MTEKKELTVGDVMLFLLEALHVYQGMLSDGTKDDGEHLREAAMKGDDGMMRIYEAYIRMEGELRTCRVILELLGNASVDSLEDLLGDIRLIWGNPDKVDEKRRKKVANALGGRILQTRGNVMDLHEAGSLNTEDIIQRENNDGEAETNG